MSREDTRDLRRAGRVELRASRLPNTRGRPCTEWRIYFDGEEIGAALNRHLMSPIRPAPSEEWRALVGTASAGFRTGGPADPRRVVGDFPRPESAALAVLAEAFAEYRQEIQSEHYYPKGSTQ